MWEVRCACGRLGVHVGAFAGAVESRGYCIQQ